jgi:hypothetical protein
VIEIALVGMRVGSPRFYALLGLAGVAVAVAAIAAVRISDSGGSSNLRPLPPGPPGPARSAASVLRVTLDEMLRTADEIFIGTATAIGGSEEVSRGTPPIPPLTFHRIRFDVDQAFRGATSGPIDVTVLDSEGANYSFTVGQKYLIFAQHTKMGGRVPALIPSGYFQGVYPVETATLARNDINGPVDLIELVEKAKRPP